VTGTLSAQKLRGTSLRWSDSTQAQKLRAEKEADAEEKNLARAILMKRIDESHEEAASLRHEVGRVREQLVGRRRDLQRATEYACSASSRLQVSGYTALYHRCTHWLRA